MNNQEDKGEEINQKQKIGKPFKRNEFKAPAQNQFSYKPKQPSASKFDENEPFKKRSKSIRAPRDQYYKMKDEIDHQESNA